LPQEKSGLASAGSEVRLFLLRGNYEGAGPVVNSLFTEPRDEDVIS